MIQALQLRFQNTDWLEAMLRAVGIEEDDRVFDYLNARTNLPAPTASDFMGDFSASIVSTDLTSPKSPSIVDVSL